MRPIEVVDQRYKEDAKGKADAKDDCEGQARYTDDYPAIEKS
jgi:hypothetical protein